MGPFRWPDDWERYERLAAEKRSRRIFSDPQSGGETAADKINRMLDATFRQIAREQDAMRRANSAAGDQVPDADRRELE